MRLRSKKYFLSGVLGAALAVALGVSVTTKSASPEAAARAPSCAAGTDVQTTSGPVCGIVANGNAEWLGIPYAAPPVGSLRWAPPQPPTPWSAALPTVAYGSNCAQGSGATASGSENCLFVNVTRPDDGTTGLPVLVHIHGGAFQSGSGNGDYTILASAGHEVVVSLNYRLGILGFLADSALGPHSGDYGLEDQQAALRWVQANIARFGGNPTNVTIYGESAGASSVCDAIASPTARGLFERAIIVSGEYNTLLGHPTWLETQDCKSALPTQAQADAAGAAYAASVGCSGGVNVAACLRSLTVARARATVGSGYQDGGEGTDSPTINGTTLTRTLRQELQTGQVNRVPVITGTGRDEDLVGSATTAASYTRLIDAQYGAHASRVFLLYPLSHFGSPAVAFRTVAADSDTVCPSLVTDADLARWMPVYGYEIDDNDLPPYRVGGAPAGASHAMGWFLPDVFTPTAATGLDADQQALQNEEIAIVTQFAANGGTSPSGSPVWPLWNRGHEVLSLQPAGDSELAPASQLAAQHSCGFWDKLAPRA